MINEAKEIKTSTDEAAPVEPFVSCDKLSIEFDVRGSRPIKFEEGWSTGDMTESGISINTVWYEDGRRYGGCINRDEATQLRDFLNECIALWSDS